MLANLPKNIESVEIRNVKDNYSSHCDKKFFKGIANGYEDYILNSNVRFLENHKGCLIITCEFEFDYWKAKCEMGCGGYESCSCGNSDSNDYSYNDYACNKNNY